MRQRIWSVMLLFAAVAGRAQLVADGDTVLLSNLTTNITGDVVIGTNGLSTLLILSNNSLLTNSAHGLIGRNATAKSNEVQLTSASRWLLASNLAVGNDGSFSRLVISNGSTMQNHFGRLGFNPSSSNNEAVITGPASAWTNLNEFSVGYFGGGNHLLVSGGGAVHSVEDSYVGLAGNTNEALVTGSNSSWTSRGEFHVGFFGRGNRLIVNNGGRVQNTLDGNLASGAAGGGNQALISGAGSVWSNAAGLYVGFAGAGNQLVVSNSALVTANFGVIGNNPTAGSNFVSVTDSGSWWRIAQNLFVGSNGPFNELVVSNGGMVANAQASIGFGTSASDNTVLVTGAGSIWSNTGALHLGESGSRNRLTITNAGRVISGGGNLGLNFGSRNNEATVTGSNSMWTALGNVLVGVNDTGNRLLVSDGGTVRNASGTVGVAFTSSDNEVVVTGSGSVWSNSLDVTVGSFGARNRLVVSNGGALRAPGRIAVGAFNGSTNNRVVVDGGTLAATNAAGTGLLDVVRGTNVLNAGLINVDQLVLTNAQGFFDFAGGLLITRSAIINNGVPFVAGRSGSTPAIWDVRAGIANTFIGGDFYLGSNVASCQLILTNGATLTNASFGNLGWLSGANSNRVTLANTGSQWLLADGLFVGDFGNANQVVVSNGATLVTGSSSVLGNQATSINNEMVVTGPGTTWNGVGFVFVGGGGSNNRLVVSDGARVQSWYGYVGHFFPTTSNNLALVTGAGSSWSNAFEMRIGNVGPANRLVVSNQAVVSANTALYVGFNPSSTGNRLIVDGGTVRVTNGTGTGILDVRRDALILNAGSVEVDRLILTNGYLEFNGGTASSKNSRINNGDGLRIGNGISPATFVLAGNGSHFFDTVLVFTNGTLTGNGTIGGEVGNNFAVLDGGTLSPGNSIGRMVFTNNLLLFGTVRMEISKNGTVLTNDHIQALGGLTYGGGLIVTNLGPTALTAGNKFQLFNAGFGGAFAALTLPPLAPGLSWTNQLAVDGSIQVIGLPVPGIANISLAGSNVIISGSNGPPNAPYAVLTTTNVALSMSNWVGLATNLFDANGNFAFTNAIVPGVPRRFYRTLTLYD